MSSTSNWTVKNLQTFADVARHVRFWRVHVIFSRRHVRFWRDHVILHISNPSDEIYSHVALPVKLPLMWRWCGIHMARMTSPLKTCENGCLFDVYVRFFGCLRRFFCANFRCRLRRHLPCYLRHFVMFFWTSQKTPVSSSVDTNFRNPKAGFSGISTKKTYSNFKWASKTSP